jgi:hypothetical protein
MVLTTNKSQNLIEAVGYGSLFEHAPDQHQQVPSQLSSPWLLLT